MARDEAFNFTYRACIDALAENSEVKYFSPLNDKTLPKCDMIYLPGGYPELFCERLTANASMRTAMREFAESGGRIYAECGGLLYLCDEIDGAEMCGVLPLKATMEGARLHLGYRKMEWEGEEIRGHEFHYSTVREPETMPKGIITWRLQTDATGRPVETAIYTYKNVVAGYTHWYFC